MKQAAKKTRGQRLAEKRAALEVLGGRAEARTAQAVWLWEASELQAWARGVTAAAEALVALARRAREASPLEVREGQLGAARQVRAWRPERLASAELALLETTAALELPVELERLVSLHAPQRRRA